MVSKRHGNFSEWKKLYSYIKDTELTMVEIDFLGIRTVNLCTSVEWVGRKIFSPKWHNKLGHHKRLRVIDLGSFSPFCWWIQGVHTEGHTPKTTTVPFVILVMRCKDADVKDRSTPSDKTRLRPFGQVRSICTRDTVPKAVLCNDQRFVKCNCVGHHEVNEHLFFILWVYILEITPASMNGKLQRERC